MKRHALKKAFYGLILGLILSGLLCSCGGRSPAPEDILARLMEDCEELPAGEIYRFPAEEGAVGALSPRLIRSMYGEDAEEVFSGVESGALFLSSVQIPREIAVFRCYSKTDASALTRLCLARADELRIALRGGNFDGFSDDDGVWVLCEGRYVVMCSVENGRSLRQDALRYLP